MTQCWSSRICLQPQHTATYKLLSDLEEQHWAVYHSIVAAGKGARPLWRVEMEPTPRFIVQTRLEPDWDRAQRRNPYLRDAMASVEVEEIPLTGVQVGDTFGYRTRFCATWKPNDGPKKGKRVPVRQRAGREAWLDRQFRRMGVGEWEGIETAGSLEHVLGPRHNFPFDCVQWQGQLVVKDPEAFVAGVLTGIGREKAFGCGLVSLRRFAR